MDSELTLQVEADLARVQEFDPETLVQRERLGEAFSFEPAVEPARRLIALFKKIPTSALNEFPEQPLSKIQSASKSVFNIFESILSFNSRSPEAESQHTNLISELEAAYQPNFTNLFPFISYAVARTVDFNRLEAEGRAAVQTVRDETKKVVDELDQTSKSANLVLEEVRSAAAEQGVNKEAILFKNEAESHETASIRWLITSVVMIAVVLAYSILSLFFPSIPILRAESLSESIQLTASKLLIFFVLAFGLFQCIRNFSAHKHNAVTNRHRQNALMTYRTLAEAGGTQEARDTILQHAAAAVYSPNDSGYLKGEERGYGGSPIVGFSPKLPASGGLGDG
ncbi:hypothetical protein KUL25_20405 [Rhodobacteraceae bacterium N5(2021)]|uniref:Uncharacterized protein n=1 Tax=Gymnodinialimonas phycosphaerae TaxID=2841589 RepID=A0A975TUR6_9RHOB|nr:hypothetical protein [Gymnodinialimonas phycosphaerae]MBY4895130.1 hypothetical protein [Gymnodinialimonas phycosphaerae]